MVETNSNDGSAFFDDDDEETLLDLADDQFSNDGDFAARLESLSKRFRQDHDHTDVENESLWRSWVDRIKSAGFTLSESLSGGSGSLSSIDSSVPLPSAFQSEDGRQHLKATSSILNVSEHRAAALTMSALRTLDEPTNFQSLLGTRALVEKVLEYHLVQRVARISAIAECVRQVQVSDRTIITQVLNSIDTSYTKDGKNRGLFRYLLSTACQRDIQLPSRDQLLAAKLLRDDTFATLQEESFYKISSDESRWHHFVAKCLNLKRNCVLQERIRSMEALVAFMYDRIEDGVQRADYMLLLIALQSVNFFSTATMDLDDGGNVNKLSQLAGLLCAESIALWRPSDLSGDASWFQEHPLLLGVLPDKPGDINNAVSKAAEYEIETMRKFVMQCSENVAGASPELLALLSFGLLLQLSYNSILASYFGADEAGYWQLFQEKGYEMVVKASSEHSALDYLSAAMDDLVSSNSTWPRKNETTRLPYDWLFSGKDELSSSMNITPDEDNSDMDAASLTYANIGQEVVLGLVLAFTGTILDVHHASACQNLAMVCDLTSKIYRSSRTLCEPFWVEWDLMTTSSEDPSSAPPLCMLLNSAHSLVSNAAQQIDSMPLSKEQLLATITPLMQLLAALSYNSEKVEIATGLFLPPVLLQRALVSCTSPHRTDDLGFTENKTKFLSSLAALTRTGNSSTCREMIRGALDFDKNLSGPALLLKATSVSDPRCRALALNIGADLLVEAPVQWALAFARGLNNLAVPNLSDDKAVILPLATIFKALVSCMESVVFSKLVSDSEAEHYLKVVWSGVSQLSPVLPTCLSNVIREPIPLGTIAAILGYLSDLLEGLCPIIALHSSATVVSAARGIRDATIELVAASSNLGESIMFYALLPISSSIGYSLETYAQERSMHQFASMEENSAINKYGPWYSAATRSSSSPGKETEAQSHVNEIIENSIIDFTQIKEKGGLDGDEVILTVSNAMRLIRIWALHVEDVVIQGSTGFLDHELGNRLLYLSPQRLLTMVAVMPQQLRRKSKVKALWDSVNPTNLKVLTRYLDVDDSHSIWPLFFPTSCLDIINACVVQLRRGSLQENLLETSLFSTFDFLSMMISLSEKALGSTTESKKSKEEKTIGILASRVLCSTLGSLALVSRVDLDLDTLVQKCLGEIRKTCDKVHKSRESERGHILKDIELLNDLQIATACLSILRVLWKNASRLDGKLDFANYYDTESSAFASLAKVILQQAYTGAFTDSPGGEKGKFLSFLAAAVDFLRLAMAFSFNTDTNNTLMRMIREDAFKMISMPKNFTSVESCADVAAVTSDFSAFTESCNLVLSNPSDLLKFFPIVATSSDQPDMFNVDIASLTRHLSSVTDDISLLEGLKVKTFSLASSCHALSSQLALLLTWRKFTDVLVQCDPTTSTTSSPGSINNNNTALSSFEDSDTNSFLFCALQALRVLHDNIVDIEVSQTHGTFFRLPEISQMARTMAGLVLQLVDEGLERAKKTSPDLLGEILGHISVCSDKLFKVLDHDAQECCFVEQHLLASAIGVLNALEFGQIEIGSKLDNVVVELVRLSTHLLKVNESQPLVGNTSKDCVKTCVMLMTMLAAQGLNRGRNNALVLTKVLKDFQVVEMLVLQSMSYTRLALPVEVDKIDQSAGSKEYLDILEAMFDFFHLLALSGSSDLLDILYTSGALEMLARNPLFDPSRELWNYPDTATTVSFPMMRGYIPTREKIHPHSPSGGMVSFFAGKDCPLHTLWRKSLQIFTAYLRSSKKDTLLKLSKRERIAGLLADFVISHQNMIQGCLKSMDSSAFTKNVLAEATLIMSLISEMCARPCLDRRAKPLIAQGYHPIILSLVARLSSFLGASSASREYFKTVGDTDESEDEEVDASARLSPFSRLPNARHEAIRLSHYASKCTCAVTGEELESLRGGGEERSTLEKVGKAMIAGDFARAMEQLAAECLFAAVSMIWEIHPVNSSFCMFSREEASKIDAMPLVKPKTVIAFSSDRESAIPLRSGHYYQSSYVHYAQVMHCNTVDRCWYVRGLESGKSEEVNASQLLGLEDVSKRQCVLHFSPAPDSATDLEKVARSASVGHLILALRWCASQAPQPMIKRLGGLLSAFLGAELSMHTEIGSTHRVDDLNRLDAQLLNLFGETAGGSGRLKPVLDKTCWTGIRQQLEINLMRAEGAENDTAKSDMMAIDDGGIFLRNSGRNPFDDLRLNYD